jgi:hypothetical protein
LHWRGFRSDLDWKFSTSKQGQRQGFRVKASHFTRAL